MLRDTRGIKSVRIREITRAIILITGLVIPSVAAAGGLTELPREERKTYELLDPKLPTGESVFRTFKAQRAPPWKIGYASTYADNSWRASILDEFTNKIVPAFKKAGLVSEFIVTQSNLEDAVQIRQMRQMVDDGVDAIIICCSNLTALNPTIEYAYSKGVPVFSYSGYVTSPFAVNATENNMQGGFEAAKWLAEEIEGSGNVLLVSGISGFASSDSFDVGAKKALEYYPEIKIVGHVDGKWTDKVAQAEVQKFLAANPGRIDGIIVQSGAENGVINAVRQSGRDMIPIVLGGEASAACYWRRNPDFVSKSFHFWPPRSEAGFVWDVMMRTLEGQGPKIQTILRPAIPSTIEDVMADLPADCDPNSEDWIEPKNTAWWSASAAAKYFDNPADPLSWKPAD
ncbi:MULTISPECIES: ABC transporter substrate-binding protein [Rhizobium]|jgi:ribose transport system substrate-binding protein|uniref:Sugar ABC transporter, substrate-binding protein n=6 Tax=Rhizobium TaxID=379 RepID=Q8KIL8_RHIEC|nr:MULTISPECIES: ABC transporter substrate-binding protein [Rhizobium]ACE93837.1 putative sugar ABC transporter, substrate-binding protein [Rhizobium etli CIAT 652]AJC82257.1 sugar ABC transporter substrate-binding protein [Rhizobium etli bv. phaseoli str. IE4803]UWU38910.1 ABC transporter substrate-binding protein [Rhizobium leguminosarum bv. phaseoli]AAM54945.1 putative sugar ABC transporter, substrate-binding protein [Rhizobium etli CFN 42]ANL24466.1 sugar ABC transporter substrate-binding 